MKPNKVIAEFMEVKFDKGNFYNMGYDIFSNGNLYRSHELKYHTDWNWLMPVLRKCRQENQLEYFDKVYYALEECDINVTYKAVVEFIKDYNDGKKQ